MPACVNRCVRVGVRGRVSWYALLSVCVREGVGRCVFRCFGLVFRRFALALYLCTLHCLQVSCRRHRISKEGNEKRAYLGRLQSQKVNFW